jgi:hypothetical protein
VARIAGAQAWQLLSHHEADVWPPDVATYHVRHQRVVAAAQAVERRQRRTALPAAVARRARCDDARFGARHRRCRWINSEVVNGVQHKEGSDKLRWPAHSACVPA